MHASPLSLLVRQSASLDKDEATPTLCRSASESMVRPAYDAGGSCDTKAWRRETSRVSLLESTRRWFLCCSPWGGVSLRVLDVRPRPSDRKLDCSGGEHGLLVLCDPSPSIEYPHGMVLFFFVLDSPQIFIFDPVHVWKLVPEPPRETHDTILVFCCPRYRTFPEAMQFCRIGRADRTDCHTVTLW